MAFYNNIIDHRKEINMKGTIASLVQDIKNRVVVGQSFCISSSEKTFSDEEWKIILHGLEKESGKKLSFSAVESEGKNMTFQVMS